MENKLSSFFSGVCIFFTILLFSKFVLEYFMDPATWDNTRTNIVIMFFFCVLSLFVLEQHKRFERLPMVLVLVLQYLVALSVALLLVWISGRYEELSKHAYRDVFLSFTIPYIVGAAWYYINLIHEARRANDILKHVVKRKQQTK
ncbi:MAG: hypothetical protein K0R34_550 [Herbinix sp.]|jgi:phosphatidylserine synthase|nr:hypothetical protein [Herbinix sp.]